MKTINKFTQLPEKEYLSKEIYYLIFQ